MNLLQLTDPTIQPLFGSIFMAWDLWRIVHSLYERPPGYRTDFFLIIEICIMVGTITSISRDVSFLMAYGSPLSMALWGLPAV
jgi:hypothetical protein